MADLLLPWPARVLHPNARCHWSVRAKAAKQARESAAWATKAAWKGVKPSEGVLTLQIAFCPPDARRRDLDGCLSSLKPALDGIADALGVDDCRFRLVLDMAEPRKAGAVIVRIA